MLKPLIRKLKRVLDPYLGKYMDTFIWKYRHYIRSDWKEEYLDPKSLSHPHRSLIADLVGGTPGIRTLLEFGTGSGINLVHLSSHYPEITYSGIDINRRAILNGIDYINNNSLHNIGLSVGDATTIKEMGSSAVDYILTDAVLMYIDPDSLLELLPEMLRVCKVGIILCEQCSVGSVYSDHWRHDYQAVFGALAGVKSISLEKIDEEYWSGDWTKYGYLIEIKKSQVKN